MENLKKRAYTKRRLIKELAFRSGISQNQARAALEAIIEIAYREARENHFILPGLCKFDVVRRQARNVRNPITGEALVLPERDALRVVLSKRAKETVVARVSPMKAEEYAALMAAKTSTEASGTDQPVEEPPVAGVLPEGVAVEKSPVVEVQPENVSEGEPPVVKVPIGNDAVEEPPMAEEQTENVSAEEAPGVEEAAVGGEGEISFFCSTCGQEIIAPGEAVGCEAECPTCGALLTVPSKSVQGSVYAAQGEEQKKEIISSEEVEDMNPQALKNRTIRIDAMLLSDLEGESQPSTADDSPMTSAMKSRTMRIDLPDEF